MSAVACQQTFNRTSLLQRWLADTFLPGYDPSITFGIALMIKGRLLKEIQV